MLIKNEGKVQQKASSKDGRVRGMGDIGGHWGGSIGAFVRQDSASPRLRFPLDKNTHDR